MKTVVFTSAAINYLPKVRKLCASIRQHHPEWEIVLALADRDGGAVDFSVEPIDEVLPIDQLDIPDRAHEHLVLHPVRSVQQPTGQPLRGTR